MQPQEHIAQCFLAVGQDLRGIELEGQCLLLVVEDDLEDAIAVAEKAFKNGKFAL